MYNHRVMNEVKLTRHEERTMRKAMRQIGKAETKGESPLIPEGSILDKEDELNFLEIHKRQYSEAVTQGRLFLDLIKMCAFCGFQESQLRHVYSNINEVSGEEYATFVQMLRELPSSGQNKWNRMIPDMKTRINALTRYKNIYKDEDDELIDKIIMDDPNISIMELLSERSHSLQGTSDLISMQVEFLRTRQRIERKQKQAAQKQNLAKQIISSTSTEPELQVESDEQSMTEAIKENSISSRVDEKEGEPFLLSGRQVFWSTVRFSTNPNHLVVMPTISRKEFLKAVAELKTEGEFSIKPTSIVSALEFHLHRDALQKALASRMKYGPAAIREWIKIKRGDDRILLQLLEGDGIVFFAANRANVYQGL